jgi:GAF domain-containing protein
LLLISLTTVTAAFFGSLIVLGRSGEGRVALLTGVLGLLGVQQAFALWRSSHAPLGLDLATGIAAAGLGVSLLGFFAVIAIGRILREFDRAETLHWESMEGVRGLTELTTRRGIGVDEKLPLLLEMGCERLGLEVGLVSRVRGERYEVLAIHAPHDFPVAGGAVFALGETHCRNTLEAKRPVAIARAADAHWVDHPARVALPFEAYLAATIHVGGEPFGTLVFASLDPRRERFNATHKDLIVLMAQWIGSELEREDLLRARRQARPPAGPSPPRPLPVRRHGAPATPALQLNAALERLEKRMRRVAGPRVEVLLEPAPDLRPARALRLPLDAILLSLVSKAAEAMPEGGKLTVATANHELARHEPDVLPAVAPDRYVTISLSETSGAVDADALARVFDREERRGEAPEALSDVAGRLPLSTVYRMLQRAGGDLSVEVEPGQGSTFTVFLPIAEEARHRPQAPRPSRAPEAPTVDH